MTEQAVTPNDRFPAEAGDVLIRSLPGGRRYHGYVAARGPESAASIASRGVPVEQSGAGQYLEVEEASSEIVRRVGRRITDAHGRLLPGHRLARADGGIAEVVQRPGNHYPGVTVVRRRGAQAAALDMSRLGGQSVGELARLFHMTAEAVLRTLLQWPENAAALRVLHDQVPHSWVGIASARRDLRTAQPYVSYRRRRDGDWVTFVEPRPRSQFRIPSNVAGPLMLPANAGFLRDLALYQRWIEQERRRQELAGPLREALRHVSMIATRSSILRSSADGLRDLLTPRLRELGLLQSLSLMLSAMKQFPKTAPDAGDRRDVDQFASRLQQVTAAATDVMLTHPVGYRWWSDNIRQASGALLGALENRELVNAAAVVARHWDLVPAQDRTRIGQVFVDAYRLLVASPRENDAVRHLEPLVTALGAGYSAPSALPSGLAAGFAGALRGGQSPTNVHTAIGHLALAAGVGSRTVANLPGPNSLAIALLNVIGPVLMGRLQNAANAATLGGKMYRALVAVTRLDSSENARLLAAIARRNHQGMADARTLISRKVPGRTIGGAMVLLNIAAMLNVWVSDERLTLRSWADIVGGGIGATLGAARVLATLDTLQDARVLSSLATGTSGKALGFIGGALAIYSGTELAIREYNSGDIFGTVLAGADVAAGTVSVVGFLMTAGAANAWNGVGEVLMLIGAIIGLVAFVWSSLRDYFTAGPKKVAEGFLEQFKRRGGAYDLLRITLNDMPASDQQRVRALRQNVDELSRKLQDTDFWNISLDGAVVLLDLDFCPPHISVLTDADEDAVKSRLRRHTRWNESDRRRCQAQQRRASDQEESALALPVEGGANRRLRADEVRYLVLEGGGGKGLVFLGALRALEQVPTSQGHAVLATRGNRLIGLRGVAGSSAGAITALGLSCGMGAAGIQRLSDPSQQDFDEFFDLPAQQRRVPVVGGNCVQATSPDMLRALIFAPLEQLISELLPATLPALAAVSARVAREVVSRSERGLHQRAVRGLQRGDGLVQKLASPALLYYARNLWQDFGFFSGCLVRNFLDQVVVQQGGTPGMTFAAHRRMFGVRLVVTGSNMETGRTQFFSAEHTPNMPVADAVRISMSLPVLFKPVRIDLNTARRITHGSRISSADAYQGLWVDGGLWNNLPMTVFASDEGGTPGTLGLVLGNSALRRAAINSLGQFVGALVGKFLSDEALANRFPSYRQQIVALDTGDIGTAEFSPNPAELQRLQAAAQSTVRNYFQ